MKEDLPAPQHAETGAEPASPQRIEPLPDSKPKPAIDDPGAPARLRAIMESPAYRRADLDLEFLSRSELRAERLELEYMKVELAMKEQNVASTIVVFGGTRIVETSEAERKLADAKVAAAARPNEPELKTRVAIAERILAKSKYYQVARELSAMVSERCQKDGRCEYVICTGGGPGVMEAANRGAYEAGAKSIGLNITLPHEQFPNPYITPELCFQFRYFAIRKFHFIQRARALVAFPGGYGTLDELFEALCLVQTRRLDPLPIVLVGEEFWRGVFNAEYLAAEGVIAPEDVKLFAYAETAEQVWGFIEDFYAKVADQPKLT